MSTGLWFVGARGSIATTTSVGLSALRRNEIGATGLVTACDPFDGLGLVDANDLVVGGHDLSSAPLSAVAHQLESDGVFPRDLVDEADLAAIEERIRPGFGGERLDVTEAIDSAVADLQEFRRNTGVERTIVVNVASTEAPVQPAAHHTSLPALQASLESGNDPLPPSSLYAYAALQSDCAFVDFTPSTGARLPALEEIALERRIPVAGSDGKTGETLLKSVMAPMFSMRNLHVQSWAGTNLLGGGDGASLAEPSRKQSKIESKAQVLDAILGYETEHPVHIDNVQSMGQWKTAWNHIAFEGFFGTRMTMQFTWQGCDSALAAPLVIDLVRLVDMAWRRGESGPIAQLGFFFKDPVGMRLHDLATQYRVLCEWAQRASE